VTAPVPDAGTDPAGLPARARAAAVTYAQTAVDAGSSPTVAAAAAEMRVAGMLCGLIPAGQVDAVMAAMSDGLASYRAAQAYQAGAQ
jgi:hypothetical protein